MGLPLYGCAVMDGEEPAQASGVAALQSDDEAEQNLAAIRALFPQRVKPTPPAPDTSDKRSSESDALPWPPDWLSAYLSPPQSSVQESDLPSICAIFIFVSLQASGCFTGREVEDSPGHYTVPPQFGNRFAPPCSGLYGASADWICLPRIEPVRTGFARWATVSSQLRYRNGAQNRIYFLNAPHPRSAHPGIREGKRQLSGSDSRESMLIGWPARLVISVSR
jgi:hypothetical protein